MNRLKAWMGSPSLAADRLVDWRVFTESHPSYELYTYGWSTVSRWFGVLFGLALLWFFLVYTVLQALAPAWGPLWMAIGILPAIVVYFTLMMLFRSINKRVKLAKGQTTDVEVVDFPVKPKSQG